MRLSPVPLVLALATGAVLSLPARAELAPQPKIAATQAALRDLWLGHVFWVRNVAVATMNDDAAAAKVAEDQVVANAKQLAAAIEPFYGKPASEKMFTLLAGHWAAVKEHVDATRKRDTKAQEAAMTKGAANAAEIAAFLGAANPHLPKDTLQGLLVAHLAHHAAQNVQLRDEDHAAEAQTWEHMRHHMYDIADALGSGIAKQFPSQF